MAINFSSRPSENSDPWYSARENYDQSLEAGINQVDRKVDTTKSELEDGINQVDSRIALPRRGFVPDGSDLDDFYGRDYAGVWWFTNSNQMENAPVDSSDSGVLEIITGGNTGSNSTKQVYSTQRVSYWREAVTASEGSWGDWYKYVTDQDLEAGLNQVDGRIALPTRGLVPDGSDLDDFYGPEYGGVWRFASSTTMLNAPFEHISGGVLEVITEGASGGNSTKQVFTNHNLSYWREAFVATEGSWGDWHKYVTDQDLEAGLNQVDGRIALPTRGLVPDGSDLDDFYGRDYAGVWWFTNSTTMLNTPFEQDSGGVLEVVTAGATGSNSTKQVFTNHDLSYWREAFVATEGSWGDWHKYVTDQELEGTPSSKIKALAKQDGWYCLYDPSDPFSVDLDEDGRILGIRDGLDNQLRMSSSTRGHSPEIVKNEFGQLNGFTGGLLQNYFNETLNTYTILMLFKGYDPKPSEEPQTILGSRNENPPSLYQISIRDQGTNGPQLLVNHGNNAPGALDYNTRYRLYRGTHRVEGESDVDGGGRITLDGEFKSVTRGGTPLRGMSLGSKVDYTDRFDGSIGLVLIYKGEVEESKIHSMEALITSLTGINADRKPQIDSRAVVYTVDEHDREVFVHGDPDRIDEEAGTASITKLMTLWLARQHLADSDMDQIVEIDEYDARTARFDAGDRVTLRDLFYATGMRSDNTAPNSVARACGAIIDPSGDHREAFISAMNDEAERLGYKGSYFPNPQHSANMSARQVVDLFKRAMRDPILREAFKLGDQDITITRPSGSSHTLTMTSTATMGDPYLTKEIYAAKTGTQHGFGHVVCGWTDEDGIEYVTATLSTKSSPAYSRYLALNKSIVKTPQ